ncbi:MAG: hypothetical protein KAI79_06660 [Bacteroidales bacterium]|nr:hypothetical protein [Bacteroidales bacterium]
MSIRYGTKAQLLLYPPSGTEIVYAVDTRETGFIFEYEDIIVWDAIGNEIPSNGIQGQVLKKNWGLENSFIWSYLNLAELGDVDDTLSPNEGDVLVYESGEWTSKTGASGTFTTTDSKTVTVSNGIITSITI